MLLAGDAHLLPAIDGEARAAVPSAAHAAMAGADIAIETGDRDSDGAAQAAAGNRLGHRIVSRVEGLMKVRLLYNRADFSRHFLSSYR
jgi:hypothetical protein